MTDLEIIKLLEIELKISLEGKEDLWKNKNSYKIDKNGFVTGLNLYGANLTKIPDNILKLKKLRHLNLSQSFIKDISPLLNLNKLENLYLEGNNDLSDESLIEFVKNAPKLKIFDFFGSWFHTIFPKDLLNHNLSLITREFGDEEKALYMEDYDVFPPLPMLELGYNNPQFYYKNYSEQLINAYKIRQTRTYHKRSTESVLNETKNEIIKSLLEKYYQPFKKICELPCAIRKIRIYDYQGIKKIPLNNIGVNEVSKEINDPNWIFLTGENGYGKTSLLQAIVIGLVGDKDGSTILKKDSAEIYLEFKNGGEYHINSIDRNHYNCKNIENFAAYGPARLNKSSDEMPPTYSLFKTDGKLLDIEGKLNLWYNKKNNHKLYENISQILLDLLSPYIDKIKIDEKKGDYTVLYHEKSTDSNDWKIFEELASGYRSIIAMFGDMILRLRKNQQTVKNAKDLSGIVLIDEFDLHLHPKWQRDLVEKLTKTFPNIQFIVSTHSPIPLLGAPPDKTVILNVNRTKEEGITVKRLKKLEKDLKFLSPNQLLTSDIFGMEEIENIYLTEKEFDEVPVENYQKQIEKNKKIKQDLEVLAKNKELFPENLFNDKDN